MKTNAKSIMAFSIALAALAFLAFKKSENKRLSEVRSLITQGKWRVNLYRDNGADETNNFTGYEFQFKPNGTLVAFKENTKMSGHWKSILEDRTPRLYIDFDSASHLDELSEDWQVKQHGSDTLELEDITTGHGGTDYLSLQKIS
ncbi:MAG: hypothetical protein K0Q95_85 [Bacteroidota bacterium]|jgi:hypothetical protein|nr:hypothetical protein [Bacteroidota bacterium]